MSVRRSSSTSKRHGIFCTLREQIFLAILVSLLLSSPIRAATPSGKDAQQLAREVIQNEVQAEANNHALWCYRETKKSVGKEMLYEYCETREGTLHRLLAINGHPLPPQQRQKEDARLQKLVRSPGATREEQRKQSADAEQERKFLRLFPDVFLFQEEERHGELVKLRFTPNPHYQPSANMPRVLHSLEGTMVADV